MATTMTVKGQVTIPRKVREALGLSPGDRVDFDVNREGQVVVHKAGAHQRAAGRAGRRSDLCRLVSTPVTSPVNRTVQK